MVTTPVPPTPVTMMLNGSCTCGIVGSGSAGSELRLALLPADFFSWPPSTVTKLGQKPSTQE